MHKQSCLQRHCPQHFIGEHKAKTAQAPTARRRGGILRCTPMPEHYLVVRDKLPPHSATGTSPPETKAQGHCPTQTSSQSRPRAERALWQASRTACSSSLAGTKECFVTQQASSSHHSPTRKRKIHAFHRSMFYLKKRHE